MFALGTLGLLGTLAVSPPPPPPAELLPTVSPLPMVALAALKCPRTADDMGGAAILIDGEAVWTAGDFRELGRQRVDDLIEEHIGGSDEVVRMHIICRGDLERWGVDAHEGLSLKSKASGWKELQTALATFHSAQRSYREDHGAWAPSLESLELDPGHAAVSLEFELDHDGENWLAVATHAEGPLRCVVVASVPGRDDGVRGTPRQPECTPLQRADDAS